MLVIGCFRKFLLRRILPNPVALLVVKQSLSGHAAAVLFIPADGIEDELTIAGSAIFVRLAGNDIVRQLGNRLRNQRVQIFWKLSIGQPVAFKRAGESGFVRGGLGRCRPLGYFMQCRQQYYSQELMTGTNGGERIAPGKCLCQDIDVGFDLSVENLFLFNIKRSVQLRLKELAIM